MEVYSVLHRILNSNTFKKSVSSILIFTISFSILPAYAMDTDAQAGNDLANIGLNSFQFPSGSKSGALDPNNGEFEYFSTQYKRDASGNILYDASGNPQIETTQELHQIFTPTDYGSLGDAFNSQNIQSQQTLNTNIQNSGTDTGGSLFGDNSAYETLTSGVLQNETIFSKNSLQNTPILNDTRNVFSDIKNNPMFSSCASDFSYTINTVSTDHVEDLKYCRETLPKSTCTLNRQYHVTKEQSCTPGTVLNRQVMRVRKDFAKDGKSTMTAKQICSNSQFTFQLHHDGGECSPHRYVTVNFDENTSTSQPLGSFQVCEKYYSGLNKKKSRKTHTLYLLSPVTCDGWRCRADFRLAGYRESEIRNVQFEKTHTRYTMHTVIEEDPPGCLSSDSCAANPDLAYVDGMDVGTDTWKCTDNDNSRLYEFPDSTDVVLDASNNLLDGIYDDTLFARPTTVESLFPGDTKDAICYQAQARNYQCENDNDLVYDYNNEDPLKLYDLRTSGWDNCDEYTNSSQCVELDKRNVKSDNYGTPLVYAKKYDCGYPEDYGQLTAEESMTCSGPIKCMGEDCVSTRTQLSDGTDFVRSMNAASIGNSIADSQKDCSNAMTIDSVDLKLVYDVYFVINQSDPSNADMGMVTPLNTVKNSIGYDVTTISMDGNGLPSTPFAIPDIDGSIASNRPQFLNDYLAANPYTTFPLVFVATKADPNQKNLLITDRFATAEKVDLAVNEFHNANGSPFDTSCAHNPKVFKGKRMKCKISDLGIAKIDCCKASKVGVKPSIQQYYSVYKVGKKMDETFQITQTAINWFSNAFPETAGAIADLSSNISGLFSSGSSAASTSLTQSQMLAQQTSDFYATGQTSSGLSGITQTLTNYAADGIGEVFGSAAKDSLFTATNAAGEQVAASAADATNFSLSLPPAVTYIYYAYVAYNAIMTLIELFFGCDEKDVETVRKRENLQCAPIYSSNTYAKPNRKYCSKDTLFGCIQRKKVQCCFDSPITAILHEEIKRIAGIGPNPGGINPSYGSTKNMDCDGFTPEQLNGLDWSLLDGNKIVRRLIAVGQIKDPSRSTTDELNDFIDKRYNLNTMTGKNMLDESMIETINQSRQDNKEQAEAFLAQLQTQEAEIQGKINALENEQTTLQNTYNAMSAADKSSPEGVAISERLFEIDVELNGNGLASTDVDFVLGLYPERTATADNITALQDDIATNPAYQPMSMDAKDYTELGDMPKKFGGDDVNEIVNNLKSDQRNEALNSIP